MANPPSDLAWSVCYAAGESRPVEVYLNGTLLSSGAAAAATGGWEVANRKCINEGRASLRSGENTLRLHRNGIFPHIGRLTFNQTHP